MKKALTLLFATGLLGLLASAALALPGDTATQSVTFQIDSICRISTSGNPAALIISAAVPGSDPTTVSNALTTYAVTTNVLDATITAAIDADMPPGVNLSVALAAPTGATSAGDVSLDQVDRPVVTGLTGLAVSGKTITYKLSATAAAGVIASDSRTVTFTILQEIG
jgi:hypothetical protein